LLSPLDMIVIGGAALLFFGPDQLPGVARKVGGVVRELQMTSQTFIREMERAADDAEAAKHPGLDPVVETAMPELPLVDHTLDHMAEDDRAAEADLAEADLAEADHAAEGAKTEPDTPASAAQGDELDIKPRT
jgi:Sec-independent protein translocase protein TatA